MLTEFVAKGLGISNHVERHHTKNGSDENRDRLRGVVRRSHFLKIEGFR
jgi:hypothetical protein